MIIPLITKNQIKKNKSIYDFFDNGFNYTKD